MQASLKNSTSLINTFRYLQQHLAPWLKFSDSLEGANDGTGGTPVAVSPVLSSSQEVLSASVIGVLIEDPVAIHNITRVDVAVMETVRQTGTVIHELHHVAAEVWLFIDAQPIGASILWDQKQQRLDWTLYLIRDPAMQMIQPFSFCSLLPVFSSMANMNHVPLESCGMSEYSC